MTKEQTMTKKQKEKLAEDNRDIPTAEIQQDIVDTQREILEMEEEAEHLANTPLSMKDARWNHMRAEARKSGIKERQEFIEKLKVILEVRGVTL